MNIAAPFLEQVRQASPGGGWTAESFNNLIAQILAGYHVQHNADDTHKTITASGAISERGRTTPQGVWASVPYVATDYTAPTGSTWTVLGPNVKAFDAMLIGRTLWVSFYLEATNLSVAAATRLRIRVPLMATLSRLQFGTFAYDDNGTRGTGVARMASTAETGIDLLKDLHEVSTWSVSANLSLVGQLAFEVDATL